MRNSLPLGEGAPVRTLGRMREEMEQNKKDRTRAQELRKNQTKEERHLWYDFLKTYPVQFRRQYPVGNYYVDFYCYRAQLVVELDGSQHCEPEQMARDQKRSEFLNAQGLKVLRFSNLDVWRNFREVCEVIHREVNQRLYEG